MRGLLLALLLPAAALAQEGPTATVQLADGSTEPLRPWRLSYEYAAVPHGTPATLAPPQRTDSDQLWLGKKAWPLRGSVLEIQYLVGERTEEDEDGKPVKVKLPKASALVLIGPDGKRNELKLEAPNKDFLRPDEKKDVVVAARTLDLRGETLTGTKRDFCLASFTSLVECIPPAGQQVVRIEFSK